MQLEREVRDRLDRESKRREEEWENKNRQKERELEKERQQMEKEMKFRQMEQQLAFYKQQAQTPSTSGAGDQDGWQFSSSSRSPSTSVFTPTRAAPRERQYRPPSPNGRQQKPSQSFSFGQEFGNFQ